MNLNHLTKETSFGRLIGAIVSYHHHNTWNAAADLKVLSRFADEYVRTCLSSTYLAWDQDRLPELGQVEEIDLPIYVERALTEEPHSPLLMTIAQINGHFLLSLELMVKPLVLDCFLKLCNAGKEPTINRNGAATSESKWIFLSKWTFATNAEPLSLALRIRYADVSSRRDDMSELTSWVERQWRALASRRETEIYRSPSERKTFSLDDLLGLDPVAPPVSPPVVGEWASLDFARWFSARSLYFSNTSRGVRSQARRDMVGAYNCRVRSELKSLLMRWGISDDEIPFLLDFLCSLETGTAKGNLTRTYGLSHSAACNRVKRVFNKILVTVRQNKEGANGEHKESVI